MAFEFKFPDLGEGVHEGEIVQWLVAEGDVVRSEQPLVEVMTDKVTAELPSPVAGKVTRLGGKVGEVLPVGSVLVTIETEGAAPKAAAVAPRSNGAVASEAPTKKPEAVGPGGAPLAVPAVRRLAKEMGVDLATVAGSGPGGRIMEADIRASAGSGSEVTVSPTGAPKRVPLRGMRRVIAEHLLSAQRNTAPYTYVEEVDFTELVRLRERLSAVREKTGVHLTYLPFILAAVSMALKEHPFLNATVDEASGDLLLHSEQHLGVAVHTEYGLVVPVLRHVEQKNLLDLAREIERLSAAARAGKLSREEVTGSTFSITSLGQLGGLHGTPMLNTPEVAVLGVHRIQERPAVRDGAIVPRHLGNLSLTLDHRYIDGFIGAQFAATLVKYLEDPAVMLFWPAELRDHIGEDPGPAPAE
jgi:pyruvate dehydrogenase E2 component (dihydrolipoamide acetyltransferase)